MNRAMLCAFALVPAVALAGKHPAVERTEKFVALLLKVKQAEEGKTLAAADKAANEKVFKELDGYFDYDHLTSAPISPRADKFSKDEKAEFQKKFREVIRLVAYPDSGSFFRKAKWTLGEPKEKGDVVVVPMDCKVVKDDIEMKVDLHFKKAADGLKIVDVAFDGDSLVKDYQNQFVRIIDKEGAKGLIAKVDKKRSELDSGVSEQK